MKNIGKEYLERLKKYRRRRRKVAAVLACLSLFVAGRTVWALHIDGEGRTGETYCGYPEEHQHTEECAEKTLICGLEEDATEPDESQTEASGHVHMDGCYEITYICGYDYEHTHALSCFSNPDADVETAGDWEKTFADVELTGDFAEDLIAIAKTQLGYAESTDNYQVLLDDEGNETEQTKGYTRYGAWYGDAYGDWCAMFVSFCLNYADVPETAFPRDAVCQSWVEALSGEAWEMYHGAGEYFPYPGDIVFFDWDDDGEADHVGIVSELTPEYTGTEEYYENDPDYTLTGFKAIEGNSENKVKENEYELTDETILGYGALSLAYGTAAQNGVTAVDSLQVTLRTMTYKKDDGKYNQTSSIQEQLTSSGDYTCYEYTENEIHYYLIPVSYLEEKYKEYGFTFSNEEAQTCPFSYRTSGEKWTNQAAGLYEEYGGSYYLKVKCTKGNTPVVYYTVLTEAADTVTPSSTVIHMFDYWTTENRSDSDNHSSLDDGAADMTRGINQSHALKFGKNMGTSYGLLNYSWGGDKDTPSKVTAGIVENTLGADGYPVLTNDGNLGTNGESLSYLFNPNEEAEGKASFSRVAGLLSVDAQGYFYYNSTERYAQLDENTKTFTVYEQPAGYNDSLGALDIAGDYGQFYPYNDAHQVALLGNDQDPINHYFGMTLTTRFVQKYDGYTTSSHATPTTFSFSGDNDVWIFIDDVLVADLGGLSSARNVTIDFATGEVTISDGTSDNPSTTLRKAFQNAGKEDSVKWQSDTSNTFADNTTHTLKFYYLERGNYDSNLMLKYNLTDIPATSIYKVDQYGDSVGGAAFAVYKAQNNGDGTYSYLLDDGTAADSLDSYYVDPEIGTVYTDENKATTVIEKPAYLGTTDENGQMIFTDGDGMPYSISELRSMFGEYFFLREIKVPEGYHTVSDDVAMWIDPEVEMMQTAESPYLTGVWSSPDALVTATNTLYIASENDYGKFGNNEGVNSQTGEINYYALSNDGTWQSNGTLFAVVLDRGEAGVSDFDSWMPIMGNDAEGYETLVSGTASAIQAAKSYGISHMFSYAASGMQVLIEELPGELSQYYTYQETKEDFDPTDDTKGASTKYLVAYYWTSADSLDGANADNTVRVASHNSTTASNSNFVGFTVQWGATIEVPNVINALYFQKADEAVSTLIDDAVFALYATETDESGAGYYVAADENGSEVYIRLDENSEGKTAYGTATVYISLEGTGTEGSYSISADNITIPKTDGTGLITDGRAGTITVTAGGKAYTITPAKNARSQNLVGYTHDKCDTVSEDGTGHFKYLKTGNYFLKEIVAPAGYVLNSENVMVMVNNDGVYACAGDADNGVRVGNGSGYLVKTLDVFASVGRIDETLSWVYGLLKVDADNTTSFRFHAENAAFYGVNDIHYPLLPGNATSGGLTTDGGDPYGGTTAMVAYLQYDGSADAGDSIFDYVVVDNATHNETISCVSGTETLRLWTEIGWSDMGIYQDTVYGMENTLATTEYTELDGDIGYLFSSSTFVQVSDARIITTDIQLVKADSAEDTEAVSAVPGYNDGNTQFTVSAGEGAETRYSTYNVLTGAEFKLYRISKDESSQEEVKLYYGKNADGTLTVDQEEANAAVLQVDGKGYLKITGLSIDYTYYLVETKAPCGYSLPADEVRISWSNGALAVSSVGAVTQTIKTDGSDEIYIVVYNSGGYKLPDTGGTGTTLFALCGLAMMMGTLGYGCGLRRKRKERRGRMPPNPRQAVDARHL